MDPWTAAVEMDVYEKVGGFLTGLPGGVVDTAVETATEHNHNSFVWTMALTTSAAADCRRIVTDCADRIYANARPGRRKVLDAARASEIRPVVSNGILHVGGSRFKCGNAGLIIAYWDLCWPSGPILADFRSVQLLSSNAQAISEAISTLLSSAAIALRVATLRGIVDQLSM